MPRLYGPWPGDTVRPWFEWDDVDCFPETFAKARREGWPLFRWRGELFTTRREDDLGHPTPGSDAPNQGRLSQRPRRLR